MKSLLILLTVLSVYFFFGQAAVIESYDPIVLHQSGDSFKCRSFRGSYPHPKDCSKYYSCTRSYPSLKTCSQGQLFDADKSSCKPANEVNCDSRQRPDKITTETTRSSRATTPSADSFTCPSFKGSYPHPKDCSKYYSCTRFYPSLRTCRQGQLFDAVKSSCKPANEVNCGSRQRPDKITTGTTSSSKEITPSDDSFLCPRFFGTYPHPRDCSKYYSCKGFHPSLKTCRRGQLFDVIKSSCKPANEVDCGSRQRPGTTTPQITTETTPMRITTTLTTETITKSTILTTLTKEEEPVTNTPTIKVISTTEDFPTGPPETDCDEDDVDCIINETGDITKWFKCPDDIGAFVHPSSDKLFIFCMNWIPSVKKCGMNRMFSEKLRTCTEISYVL